MLVKKVRIENFRLLKDVNLDFREDISLLVGKNNTGKTSLIALFERFLYKPGSFRAQDFSLEILDQLKNFDNNVDEKTLSIKLILEIEYSSNDDLSVISDFILDLDEKINTVKILLNVQLTNLASLRI